MVLPCMLASGTMQAYKRDGHSENHKSVGLDGLPPSFLKNGGEVLTSKSTELPGLTCEKERIPK